MTQKEKIELLKNTIIKLYEKEGRSKSYISRLLEVDRKTLTYKIKEWDLTQAQVSRLTPSNQKWWNANRDKVISMLDRDITITNIERELNRTNLTSTYISKDSEAQHHLEMYHTRARKRAEDRKEALKDGSSLNYDYTKIEGEEWKDILGYPNYQVSNKGRIRSYKKSHDAWALMTLNTNVRNGRIYVRLINEDKESIGLSVPRLVAFNFVKGHTSERNTVNHKDLDVTNNEASNLEWVSQSENNQHSYSKGRSVVVGGQLLGDFEYIEVDDKYQFKTVTALAKFLDKSVTQTYRYITGETAIDRKIKVTYKNH